MRISSKIFRTMVESIQEINRKYKKPQIQMTLFVKICLMALRVYLILLIGVMIFKFVTML